MAAQIVLARGEKDRWGFTSSAVVKRSLPPAAWVSTKRLHASTALDANSRGNGLGDERGIKRLPSKRSGGKRQWSFGSPPGSGEANVVDAHGAKRGHVDAERVKILKGLTAKKLSTDFMTRCGFPFNQSDASPLACERDGGGTACHSTTEDENFFLQWDRVQIGCTNGKTPFADLKCCQRTVPVQAAK
jgi:hypothetical protein